MTNTTNRWTIKRLDQIATVIMGQSPSSSSYNTQGTGVPFLQGMPPVIDSMGAAVPKQWTTEPTRVVEAGTALMTVRAPVGELFTTNNSVCLGRGLAGIKANNDVSQAYLNYYLQFSKKQLDTFSQGSTFTAINSGDLKGIQVALPSYQQQKYVESVLNIIDQDIAKTYQIIQKAKVLKQGLMRELLTKGIGHKKFKKTKIGEIPEEWELYSLGDLCNFITGKLNSNQAVIDGKYPFFTCAQETFAIDRYSFDCEAVLLAGNNASGVYSVKYYKGKFNAYQRTYIITIKDTSLLDYFFLKEILNIRLNMLKDFSVGTNTKFLTLKLLLGIKVLLPPVKEQVKISNILMSLESKKHMEMQKRNLLLNLKKGLMQDIFNQKVQIK